MSSKNQGINDFFDQEASKMYREGITEIDLDDASERIVRTREHVHVKTIEEHIDDFPKPMRKKLLDVISKRASDVYIRGWSFSTVRKTLYDRFQKRKAISNKRLQPQLDFKYAEFLPEWIPGERAGKLKLLLLDYDSVFLEDVEEVIAARKAELATKQLDVLALEAWRDHGLESGQLKRRPIDGKPKPNSDASQTSQPQADA